MFFSPAPEKLTFSFVMGQQPWKYVEQPWNSDTPTYTYYWRKLLYRRRSFGALRNNLQRQIKYYFAIFPGPWSEGLLESGGRSPENVTKACTLSSYSFTFRLRWGREWHYNSTLLCFNLFIISIFASHNNLDVTNQVDLLIKQATSHENLLHVFLHRLNNSYLS